MYFAIGFIARNPEEIPQGWSLFLDYVVEDSFGRRAVIRGGETIPDYELAQQAQQDENYFELPRQRSMDPERHSLFERSDGSVLIGRRDNPSKHNLQIVSDVRRAA